jgi:hypothetical protein
VRFGGLALFLVGLLATVVCSLNGCNSFFAWNGRHAVQTQPLIEEHTHATFKPVAARRYTLSVQVVFDPAHVDDSEGMADVEVKMPLVVKAKDAQGTSFAEAIGWLEREKPNIFYSRPLREPTREIMLERLVGPFMSANVDQVDVDVTLGPDRVGRNVITARRLVIYDDSLPPPIRNAAIGTVSGVLALVTGSVLLVTSWWRSRRRRKRSGIPRVPVV